MEQRSRVMERLNTAYGRFNQPRLQRLLSHPFSTTRRVAAMRLAHAAGRLLLQTRLVSKTFFGEELRVPVPPCQDIWLYGLYLDKAEINLMRYLIQALRAGDNFLDVGANIGFYSLLGAHLMGATGRVFAFEPCPSALPLLEENVAQRPTIEVVSVAVSHFSGQIDFHVAPGQFMVSSSANRHHLEETGVDDRAQTVSVPCTKLDDFLEERGVVPAIIKLDVEGTEREVLAGAADTLERHRPDLVMEVSFTKSAQATQEALSQLNNSGYCAFVIEQSGALRPINMDRIAEHGERVLRNPLYFHGLDNMVFRYAD